jgi:ABC-type multidrug transport system permease subunit
MKIIKDTLIIAWMKAYPDLKRNPLVLIVIALISAIPLFFMAVFASEGMLIHGLIGAMVSTISFIGVATGIQDISWDRYVKIREMIVAMPVHPASYAVGIALAPLLLSVPSLLFFGAITALWGYLDLPIIIWTILTLVMTWAAMSAIGFIISTYLYKASPWLLNNISNLLGLGLIFIPPVYYTETLLGSLSWISVILPTSNAAGLIRYYFGLLPLTQEAVLIRWLILIVTTAAFVVLTSAKAKWRET